MVKYEEKGCTECGNHYIQNKTLWLCSECVYKRNHDGKSRFEVARDKAKLKAKNQPKPKAKVYKKKATGEREMFLEIWNERPHNCVKCGKRLPYPMANFFSHIKPKSTHPELRLCKSNVELLCAECHYNHEFR